MMNKNLMVDNFNVSLKFIIRRLGGISEVAEDITFVEM